MEPAAPSLFNPYVAGRALDEDRAFFGRDEVFKMVETEFRSPDRNAIVLFGQRRIGKTSILKQLQRRLPSPPFVVAYFDLMNRAYKPLGYVLWEIAALISDRLEMSTPDQSNFDDYGRRFRSEFLPKIYDVLGSERRLLLLFDEFDVLDSATQPDVAQDAASRSFFPYLTELMGNEPKLGFVFVVGRQAEDLTIDAKGVFKAARYKRISVLEDDDAIALIRTAERQGSLNFADGVPERILELSGGHPFFIQLVCQMLWDQSKRDSVNTPHDTPKITEDSVSRILPRVMEAGASNFEWIWDGLPPAEKVVFSAIAEVAGSRPRVDQPEIETTLRKHGIRILAGELELAPETLVKWEMLRRVADGYCFCVELMRVWVAQRKPLAAVKDELDRINPVAETLYQSGKFFYDRRLLDKAEHQLRESLAINLNHIKGRVLLSQLLQEQGKYREAVQELDLLFQYDERAATNPLVKALSGMAEALERETKSSALDVELFKIYERILALSPKETIARTRLNGFLAQRGHDLVDRGEFEGALAAFRQAGFVDRIAEVQAKAREEGDRQAKQGNWDKALDNYRLSEAEDRIQEVEKLKAAREKIWQRYKEAKEAAAENRTQEAVRAFADVVYLQPDFEDAAQQLEGLVSITGKSNVSTNQSSLWGEKAFLAGLASWMRCVLAGFFSFVLLRSSKYIFSDAEWFRSETMLVMCGFLVFTSVSLLFASEFLLRILFSQPRSGRWNGLKRTVLLIFVGYPSVMVIFFNLGWRYAGFLNDGPYSSGRSDNNTQFMISFLAYQLPIFVAITAVGKRAVKADKKDC